MNFADMPSTHFIFIPAVMIVGVVIGWVLGSRAASDAYGAEMKRREERAARDLPLDRPRNADVVDEPDDVRPHERVRGRPEWSLERLDHLGLALEDEHMGTPHRSHV